MAMLWGPDSAPRTLDVLLEGLKDPSIPADAEAAIGGGKEVGKANGRKLALDGIERIGRDRVAKNAGIIIEVNCLAKDPATEAALRRRCAELMKLMPSVIENSIGMKLVYVPPGKFRMGSSATDRDQNNANEGPQHEVEITKGFHLGQHEVTVGQFKAFVASEKYLTEAEKDGRGYGINTSGDYVVDAKYTWLYPAFAATDQHPVENVSWNDAKAFCAWLSRKEGINYRLPSEAEWEYACRGGTETAYQGGDDPESLSTYGNVADETLKMKFPGWRRQTIRGKDGYVFATPVGQFRKNGFGLNDMHGNVEEWCEDRYDENYYKVSPKRDPTGPERGKSRVVRGGGWMTEPRICRSACRASPNLGAGVPDLGSASQ